MQRRANRQPKIRQLVVRRRHRLADPSIKRAADRERLATLADLATPWAIRVIVRSGVVEILATGDVEVSDLAEQAGLNVEAFRRVLRLLAYHDVVTLSGDVCALGPLGYLLVPTNEDTLAEQLDGSSFNTVLDECRSRLARVVISGEPAIEPVKFWTALRSDTTGSSSFDRLMEQRSSPVVDEMFVHWTSPVPATIADIGCGPGAILAAALRSFPDAKGIGVDNYSTAGSAIVRQADIASRFQFVNADFFYDPLPREADLYLVASVLHDWGDDKCLELLSRILKFAGPQSLVVVIERVICDGGSFRAGHLRLDIDMLVAFGGRERTTPELITIAELAGLTFVCHSCLPNEYVLLEFTTSGLK